jgi:hypothetical protein
MDSLRPWHRGRARSGPPPTHHTINLFLLRGPRLGDDAAMPAIYEARPPAGVGARSPAHRLGRCSGVEPRVWPGAQARRSQSGRRSSGRLNHEPVALLQGVALRPHEHRTMKARVHRSRRQNGRSTPPPPASATLRLQRAHLYRVGRPLAILAMRRRSVGGEAVIRNHSWLKCRNGYLETNSAARRLFWRAYR